MSTTVTTNAVTAGSKASKIGYEDIYVRDNWSDAGQVPTVGTLWASPDIIPYGSDVLTIEEMEAAYYEGVDLGRNITSGAVNNIYIRGRNLKSSPTSGRVELFVAPASLLLHPDQWRRITPLNSGSVWHSLAHGGVEDIQPGQVCASSPAFYWTGPDHAATAQASNHYCLITVVDTPDHPAPKIPDSFTNLSFNNWVASLPSVAWRNTHVLPPSSNTAGAPLTFCNLDKQEKEFCFKVSWEGISSGTLRAQCTDQRLTFDESQTIKPGKTSWAFFEDVPGAFTGTMTISYTGTRPLGPNARITTELFFVSSSASEEDKRNALSTADVLGGEAVGRGGPGYMWRLGEYTLMSEGKKQEIL